MEVGVGDLYQLLGVDRRASPQQLTHAYRRLARRYHPDRNPHTADLFSMIAQAYGRLKDPNLRAEYDKTLGDDTDRREQVAAATATSAADPTSGWEPPKPIRGSDRYGRINVSPNTGAHWRDLKIWRFDPCPACVGLGLTDPLSMCQMCGGKKKVERPRRIKVFVPAVARDGTILAIRGQGDCGSDGGERGDVLVKIRVRDVGAGANKTSKTTQTDSSNAWQSAPAGEERRDVEFGLFVVLIFPVACGYFVGRLVGSGGYAAAGWVAGVLTLLGTAGLAFVGWILLR